MPIIFDEKSLDFVLGGCNGEILVQLYELYIEQAQDLWKQLLNGYDDNNFITMVVVASSLESSSRLVGAIAFSEWMAALILRLGKEEIDRQELRAADQLLLQTISNMTTFIHSVRSVK